jgi:hypothetical protein
MFSSSRFNLDDFCIVYKSNNLIPNVHKPLANTQTPAVSYYRGNHFEYTLWHGSVRSGDQSRFKHQLIRVIMDHV